MAMLCYFIDDMRVTDPFRAQKGGKLPGKNAQDLFVMSRLSIAWLFSAFFAYHKCVSVDWREAYTKCSGAHGYRPGEVSRVLNNKGFPGAHTQPINEKSKRGHKMSQGAGSRVQKCSRPFDVGVVVGAASSVAHSKS